MPSKVDQGAAAAGLRRLADLIESGQMVVTSWSLTNGIKSIKPIKVDGEWWARYKHTGRQDWFFNLGTRRKVPSGKPDGGPGDVAVPEPEG